MYTVDFWGFLRLKTGWEYAILFLSIPHGFTQYV